MLFQVSSLVLALNLFAHYALADGIGPTISLSHRSMSRYPFKHGTQASIDAWKKQVPTVEKFLDLTPGKALDLSAGMISFELRRHLSDPENVGQERALVVKLASELKPKFASRHIVNLSLDQFVLNPNDLTPEYLAKIDIWVNFAATASIGQVSIVTMAPDKDEDIKETAMQLTKFSDHVREVSNGKVRVVFENPMIDSFRKMERLALAIIEARAIQNHLPAEQRVGLIISSRKLFYRVGAWYDFAETIRDYIRMNERNVTPLEGLVGIRAYVKGYAEKNESRIKFDEKSIEDVVTVLVASSHRDLAFVSLECDGEAEAESVVRDGSLESLRPGLNAATTFFTAAMQRLNAIP